MSQIAARKKGKEIQRREGQGVKWILLVAEIMHLLSTPGSTACSIMSQILNILGYYSIGFCRQLNTDTGV